MDRQVLENDSSAMESDQRCLVPQYSLVRDPLLVHCYRPLATEFPKELTHYSGVLGLVHIQELVPRLKSYCDK